MVKNDLVMEYASPDVQVFMIEPEGVLCDSNEHVGENDGTEWD